MRFLHEGSSAFVGPSSALQAGGSTSSSPSPSRLPITRSSGEGSAAETEVVRCANLPICNQVCCLFPKHTHTHTHHTHTHTHTHITHLTYRHDDLVTQRTSTICLYKPQRLLLHGRQPPVVLACCLQVNAKGDIIEAHYGPYSGILLHAFVEANFVC